MAAILTDLRVVSIRKGSYEAQQVVETSRSALARFAVLSIYARRLGLGKMFQLTRLLPSTCRWCGRRFGERDVISRKGKFWNTLSQ